MNYEALDIDESVIHLYSNEQQVNEKTPGTFITTSMADQAVPPANSLYFVAALQQQNVPVELFLYANGEHGYGMINPTAKVQWIDQCIVWLKKERWKK